MINSLFVFFHFKIKAQSRNTFQLKTPDLLVLGIAHIYNIFIKSLYTSVTMDVNSDFLVSTLFTVLMEDKCKSERTHIYKILYD